MIKIWIKFQKYNCLKENIKHNQNKINFDKLYKINFKKINGKKKKKEKINYSFVINCIGVLLESL